MITEDIFLKEANDSMLKKLNLVLESKIESFIRAQGHTDIEKVVKERVTAKYQGSKVTYYYEDKIMFSYSTNVTIKEESSSLSIIFG